MQSRELVKLYYRIGEVSEIVGVQPHVLRYWETEFRSIRPQKSSKGQRVYSRRDVEKLLRVKDLLRNQGFTIAGARKRLSEPAEPSPVPAVPPAPAAPLTLAPASAPRAIVPPAVVPAAVVPLAGPPAAAQLAAVSPAAVSPAAVSPAAVSPAGVEARLEPVETPLARAVAVVAAEESPAARAVNTAASDHRAKNMRKALLGLRQDLMRMLSEVKATRTRELGGQLED